MYSNRHIIGKEKALRERATVEDLRNGRKWIDQEDVGISLELRNST
jgi:hypothetical protein